MRYLIIVFALISCQEKEVTYSIVPDEIRPHYDQFYKEALNRGLRLRERPVRVIIEDVLDHAAGTAKRQNQTIRIRRASLNYGHEDNAINLEYVVFHEMFHYVLDKDHNDELLENGQLASMMHSKKVAYTVGKEHLREYYLDVEFGAKLKENRQ